MEKKLFLIVIVLFSQSYFFPLLYCQTLVINEICTSPPGVNSVNANSLYNTAELPSDNQEWIELYNPHPCNSISISCYTLAGNMLQNTAAGITPNWGAFTFPSGTVIPPLGFIIVGGNHAQVPILEFNLTNYRQTTFGLQYLDGDPTRWFLRDEFGWAALYDPNGTPVDAVYWDAYGNASNLFSASEYQQNVNTRTSCSGNQSLAAARYIAGIEYLGASSPATFLSFQRITDGSLIWSNGPITPTPHACNGPCVGPPQLNFNIQDESCHGGDGRIVLTITDGHTGPYTTNWINPTGIHTNTINNLSAGSYIVQVVDAYNCFIVYDTIEIASMPNPTVNFTSIVNETCNLGNGSVQAIVSDGNAPISYVWNTMPTFYSQTISNLSAGSYSVSITDNLGCTAFNTISILNVSGPQIIIDSLKNEMCSNSNGGIYTSVLGGTQPFSFIWNSNPPQQTQNLGNIHAGYYIVTVTDANNCKATANAQITDTPPPHLSFNQLQHDTCNKGTGYIHITASGGHPPYSYLWNTTYLNSLEFISGLSQGNYTVSVTDSFCLTTASIDILNIPGPKADFIINPPITTIDDPTFRFENWSTGNINQWSWDFGDFNSSVIRNPVHTYSTIGIYDVTLKINNDNGCRDSITKQAIVIDNPTLYVPGCFTPNDDGINDYFFVKGINISDLHLYIFNRWGEQVYSLNGMDDQWDGKYKGNIVPEGLYTWVVFYMEDYSNDMFVPKTIKGTLTILR